MKKTTKLTVLILSIVLLCATVFSVMSFASDEDTPAAVSTTTEVVDLRVLGDKDGITNGKIEPSSNGSYIRYTLDNTSYRFLNQTNGRVEITFDGTAKSKTNDADCNFNAYGEVKITTVDYLVYSFDIGTNNKFFEGSSGASQTYIRIGGQNSSNSTKYDEYKITNNSDGTATISGFNATFDRSEMTNLTFIIGIEHTDTTSTAKTISLFLDGEYVSTVTYSTVIVSGPYLRITVPKVSSSNVSEPQSLIADNFRLSTVKNSSVATEGDLAALFNGLNDTDVSSYIYNDLANWVNNGIYETPTAADVTADANTVGVKIGVDGAPLFAQYEATALKNVFNFGTDVTLTLLEDMTLSEISDKKDGTGGVQAFDNISVSGTKTFNLNGHTFSHLPLAYGSLYDESLGTDHANNRALPAGGMTFRISAANTSLVINGADAEGNNGKIVRESSRQALFRHDNYANTTLSVSDVDFDVTGGTFSQSDGSRTNPITVEFNDCSYKFTASVGYGNDTVNYTNWDKLSYAAGSFDYPNLSSKVKDTVKLGRMTDYTLKATTNTNYVITDSKITLKATTNTNYVITDSEITLTLATDATFNINGSTVTINEDTTGISNSSIYAENSTLTNTGAIYLSDSVTVELVDSTLDVKKTFFSVRNNTSTVKFTGTKFTYAEGTANYFPVGNIYTTTTFGEGCKASNNQFYNFAYNIAEGCYITENTDSDSTEYPWVVKKFNPSDLGLVANLTLYTDINYNLYIPVDSKDAYITATGLSLTEENKVNLGTAYNPSWYYLISYNIPVYEANKTVTVNFTPVKKGNAVYTSETFEATLSVPHYIGLVYADSANSNSFTLMSDLVDYAKSALTYFNSNSDVSAFTALQSNANYKPQSTPESLISGADNSNLTGYISGAHVDLENSKPKIVFTVGSATEITYSYTSLTGDTVSVTHSSLTSGQEIEIEMRAYDLNALISISASNSEGSATGTYDLAAYANSIKDTKPDAYALLVKMYNYAESAKAYKQSLIAFDPTNADLAAITVGGEVLENFSPDLTEYTVEADLNTAYPEVLAYTSTASAEAEVTVVQPKDNGNVAKITVTSKDGSNVKVYTVNISFSENFTANAEVVLKDNKDAAVTYVVDDGIQNTATNCYAYTATYDNLVFSFAIKVQDLATLVTAYDTETGKYYYLMENGKYTYTVNESNLTFWQNVREGQNGLMNEVISHTYTSAYWGYNDDGGDFTYLSSDTTTSDTTTVNLPVGSARKEVYGAKQVLEDLFGVPALTVARPGIAANRTDKTGSDGTFYPTCYNIFYELIETAIESGELITMRTNFYSADMSRDKIITSSSLADTASRMETPSFTIYNASSSSSHTDITNFEDWKTFIDYALESKGWATFCLHNVGGSSYYRIEGEDVDKLFAYTDKENIWVATYTDASKYYCEWSTSSVVSTYESGAVKVTLTDGEKDEVFDMALTVKVKVPSNWLSATDGTNVYDVLTDESGVCYVLVDIVPDSNTVILTAAE